MQLPKKAFVRVCKDGKEQYLEIGTTTEGWEHGDLVGVYELKELKTIVIKSELVNA